VEVGAANNYQNACSGTLTVAGGTVWCTNDLTVGFAGAGAGTLNIGSGGTVNVGPTATKWLIIGEWDTVTGAVNISGGNLNLMNNSSLKFNGPGNSTSPGIVNQTGGTLTFYSDAGITVGGTGNLSLLEASVATRTNTYNLNGGILIVPQIVSTFVNGTRVFNFNGGTLKAGKANATFMNLGAGNAVANVRNGGAVVDTTNLNITIGQSLVHSTVAGDNATDGGLTKLGSATLTLSGTNTYTGNTVIKAGTLELSQTVATLATNSTMSLVSGSVLQLDSSVVTNIVTTLVTNGVYAGKGLYNSANSSGFVTGAGYLQVLTGPSGPGTITNLISGNMLTLSWPAGQGWRLQTQTNALNSGLGTNWTDVAGSTSIGQMAIPVNPTNGSVFYRLVYP
jgi:autotransporter-associated beta strand protein/T5SS/PEP-CTERM-associated repeat protein